MEVTPFEEIDYIHRVSDLDLKSIIQCDWQRTLARNHKLRAQYPLLLRRERYHHAKEIVHYHADFLALYIVRGGKGTRMVNGYSYSMARGDVFLMASDNVHCFNRTIDLTLDSFYFCANLWPLPEWDGLCELPDLATYFRPGSEGFKAHGNTDYFGHLSPELHSRVESTLGQMRRALRLNQLPQHLAARGQFFALLVQLAEWRMSRDFSMAPARSSKVAEVLDYCNQNFHRHLCNEQLAKLMHFSEGHFRAVFTSEVGMSPGVYINHLRLQRAQELLHDFSLSIADIAQVSGFGDPDQMCRAFKKAFGTSPTRFRKKLEAGAESL